MNQKLRQRHRLMITACALLAVGVVAAALVARTSIPTNTTLPLSGRNILPGDAVLLAEEPLTLDATALKVGVFRTASGRDDLAVRLTPLAGEAVPGADVLVYWHAENEAAQRLPPDATLLGTLAGGQARTFALPPNTHSGVLLFYSLATQTLYEDRWALPALATP